MYYQPNSEKLLFMKSHVVKMEDANQEEVLKPVYNNIISGINTAINFYKKEEEAERKKKENSQ